MGDYLVQEKLRRLHRRSSGRRTLSSCVRADQDLLSYCPFINWNGNRRMSGCKRIPCSLRARGAMLGIKGTADTG